MAMVPKTEIVLVKNFVDMSEKYGIGILYSNGCFAAFFNDKTKLTEYQGEKEFVYIRKQPNTLGQQEYVQETHTHKDAPALLAKKLKIFAAMKAHLKEVCPDYAHQYNRLETPLLLAWRKTSHATLFRLANKVVQLVFKDQSEIVLLSKSKQVLYCSKEGRRQNFALEDAMTSADTQLTNRLNYAKEIMQQVLKADSRVQYQDNAHN